MFLLGIPAILSLNPDPANTWAAYKIMGRDIFNFFDHLSGDIIMPVCAIFFPLRGSVCFSLPAHRSR